MAKIYSIKLLHFALEEKVKELQQKAMEIGKYTIGSNTRTLDSYDTRCAACKDLLDCLNNSMVDE